MKTIQEITKKAPAKTFVITAKELNQIYGEVDALTDITYYTRDNGDNYSNESIDTAKTEVEEIISAVVARQSKADVEEVEVAKAEEWEDTHKEIKRGEKRWVRGENGGRQVYTCRKDHWPKAWHKESECDAYENCYKHCPEWLSAHHWVKGSLTEEEIAEYNGENA